jgi:glucuronosyltransferase
MESIYNKHVQKNMPDVKLTMQEATDSFQLLMTNTHPVMGFVRPQVPTTIQLGFMHVDEPQPLPENLKNYLDSSKNGVIYMSLGSNVKSSDLSEGFLDIFINTFKSLEYDVLWKWEKDDLPNKPDNVRISKWLPQTDLLAHPKIKLFITQGGQVQLFFNFF